MTLLSKTLVPPAKRACDLYLMQYPCFTSHGNTNLANERIFFFSCSAVPIRSVTVLQRKLALRAEIETVGDGSVQGS